MPSVNSSSAFRGHRRAGRGARRHMAATEPLLIACKQGPTVSVNLQVPAGTKASGLQQLLAAANGVDVSNDVTIKVKTGTGSLSCFKNLGQLLARDDPTVAAHWQIEIQEQKTVEELPAKTPVSIFSYKRAERLGAIELDPRY